jgi:hypothetical protein
MREALPDRYRVRKGRVMHRVVRRTGGGRGGDADLESQCRQGIGVKGVSTTRPRATGPEDEWSRERYWYEDCRHCPPEEKEQGNA